MLKFLLFFVVILGLSIDPSMAQSTNNLPSKTFSGHFYQSKDKNHGSFLGAFFGKKMSKSTEDNEKKECAVEFESPVAFTNQVVAEVPEKINYLIKFKNGTPAFEKFIIKVYTNDGEEYDIDPDAEGRQIALNEEHHIFDSYLIYLILGQNIHHLEIVSSSGDDLDKYVLDKIEVNNDD